MVNNQEHIAFPIGRRKVTSGKYHLKECSISVQMHCEMLFPLYVLSCIIASAKEIMELAACIVCLQNYPKSYG